MTLGRWLWLVGFLVALAVDVYAYGTLPQMRSLLQRHHWIYYLYLTTGLTLVVGGTLVATAGLVRWLRGQARG